MKTNFEELDYNYFEDEFAIEEYLKKQYNEYVKDYKKSYYDTNYDNYDQWLDKQGEVVECENPDCSNDGVVPESHIRHTDSLGNICLDCLNDGYGA